MLFRLLLFQNVNVVQLSFLLTLLLLLFVLVILLPQHLNIIYYNGHNMFELHCCVL